MPEFPTLKDIAERPEPVDVLPWVLGSIGFILIAAGLAFVFYPQWRRARQRPKMPAVEAPKEAALSHLKQLADGQSDLVPERVHEIIRTYLHRKHGALGLYRTADELLGKDGPGAPPLNPKLAPFGKVLRQAEEARYGRARKDALELISSAVAALEADSPSAGRERPKNNR